MCNCLVFHFEFQWDYYNSDIGNNKLVDNTYRTRKWVLRFIRDLRIYSTYIQWNTTQQLKETHLSQF